MGLHRKLDALQSLRPDIAVVPECAAPDVVTKRLNGTTLPTSCVWIGSNRNKGLGVFAFNDYVLALADTPVDETNPWFAPVKVQGPVSFNLVAVWCFHYRNDLKRRARENAVVVALDRYREFTASGDTVVAGDFNNHVRWDKTRNPPVNHSNSVAALDRLGLVSAYHHHRRINQGEETEPTHYWRDRRKDGPTYHIDYVFIPQAWLRGLRAVDVGCFEEWCGNGLSDHVPMVVEVDAGRERE